MPELPEVETVRRGLAHVLEGARLAHVEVRRPDLRWPFPADMAARLTGATVTALGRRSKYLLAHLDTGETLLVHLGMSGRMVIGAAQTGQFHHAAGWLPRHDHVVLTTNAGARVVFNDARRFGAMDLWPTDDLANHWLLAKLGPEPLGNAFHESHLVAAFRGRNTSVEGRAARPARRRGPGQHLRLRGAAPRGHRPYPQGRAHRRTACNAALVPVIRDVLTEAIEAGGSSLRDHRQADGALGRFQHGFRVYDREGAPCPRDGCAGIVRRVVQSGRSSFYCPACQR